MSETAWLWTESLVHWMLAWSLIVACVGVWLRLGKVRCTSVRYAGWLLATFAGLILLPAAFCMAPVMSWQDAFPQLAKPSVAHASAPVETLDELDLSDFDSWMRGMGPKIVSDFEDTKIHATNDVATMPSRLAGIPWFQLSIGVWLIGMALFLARLMRAAIRVRRLIAKSTLPVPAELATLFTSIRNQLGVRRAVRLAIHPDLESPLCSGMAGPTLLWPAASRDSMTVSQRRAALVHELSHLRRYDDVVQLTGELWRALCWFFVPIHWSLARLEREQEFLSDDLAADTLDSAHSYARLLLDQASIRVAAPTLCSSFVGDSTMADRIRRALRSDQDPSLMTRQQRTLLLTITAALILCASSVRLVGFVTRPEAVRPKTHVAVESKPTLPARLVALRVIDALYHAGEVEKAVPYYAEDATHGNNRDPKLAIQYLRKQKNDFPPPEDIVTLKEIVFFTQTDLDGISKRYPDTLWRRLREPMKSGLGCLAVFEVKTPEKTVIAMAVNVLKEQNGEHKIVHTDDN